MLSVEMAADEICAAFRAKRPSAEEAFRWWFITRYPVYADVRLEAQPDGLASGAT